MNNADGKSDGTPDPNGTAQPTDPEEEAVQLLRTIHRTLNALLHEVRQQALGDNRIWSLREAAALLGVSERTIRRRIHDRRLVLESRHTEGGQVIPHENLMRYVATLPQRPLWRRGGRPRKGRG